MTTKSETSRSRQARARRAQILDAALEIFAAQGFAATSTRQIAQRLGISEGLLFHYFPTKLALLQALAARRHDSALAGLAGGASEGKEPDLPGRTLEEQMTHLALTILTLMRQDAPLLTLLLAESLTNAETGAASVVMMESDAQGVERLLQAQVAAGALRSDLPVPVLAQGFFGALLLFFLRNRSLPDAAWATAAEAYAPQFAAAWYAGARAPEAILPPQPKE